MVSLDRIKKLQANQKVVQQYEDMKTGAAKVAPIASTIAPKPDTNLLQLSQGAQKAMFNAPVKSDIGTIKGVFNTLGKSFEALKSGAKPSREGMLNVIKQQKDMPKEQALQRQQEFASSPAGAFGYGMSDATLGSLNRAFMGDAWGNLVKTGEQEQPGYSTAGKIAGNVFMYSTVGKAVEGMGALQGIKNPFLRNLVGQQLADTAIQTPGVIMKGISDKKSAGEIAKDVGIQQGQDLAGNLIMGGIEAAIKAISKKLKAGKALTQTDVETVQSATKQAGGNAAESIDSQIKKLDDYFQQKRTKPLGGAPKAEPDFAPIGGKSATADTPQGRIYGDTPKGDIPEGMRERGFSRNVRTDTAMPDDIRMSFDEDPLFYKQVSQKETLGKAQEIFSKGEESATTEFYRLVNDKSHHAEAIPLSRLLANQALENGNIAKAREVLSAAADKLTEAGRTGAAANILREADPETFLMTMDKQIRKLNEQGLKQYGKKWANVDLLPDEITAIQGIQRGNQQAYEEVWEQIGSRIAKQLPSTGMEKFDAWRRMAMLLNPKTHIRNTVGNVIMSGMRKTSDTLGAGLEKLFGVKERTKSFGWSLNKKVASKVDETWDIVKKDILGESRWEIDNLKSLGMEKDIFKNKTLQGINEFSLKALNAEDNIFTKRAFKDALGQFMQANKLDEATDAAIAYAKRRALEATFKQANMLSDFINKAKRTPGIGRLVEGAIPFSKTPANIAARAVEYSPVGLTKLLFSKGKAPAEVIETLSKGLTGSTITALGYYLGVSGWAKVERNRSAKAEGLMQEMGDQPNSITTALGSYTFDWAQPFAVPLAMGIAAAEALKNRKDGDTIIQAVWDGVMAGGDTIFNMTMLQNIKQIFSGGSISENIAQIPVSYLEQAIPSLFGQVAKTIDDTKRSTYDPNKLKQEWNRVKSRVPGLSQTLEPSLDIWGQEQSQGGWIQQFINPGYAKKKSDDPVTNEVARLYSSNKDNDMLPKVAPKSFSDKSIEYQLTPRQLTEFQRKMGQENHAEIGRLISSAEYKSMTDEQRMKRVKKIVNDNYEDAKDDIIKASALKGK